MDKNINCHKMPRKPRELFEFAKLMLKGLEIMLQ